MTQQEFEAMRRAANADWPIPIEALHSDLIAALAHIDTLEAERDALRARLDAATELLAEQLQVTTPLRYYAADLSSIDRTGINEGLIAAYLINEGEGCQQHVRAAMAYANDLIDDRIAQKEDKPE